MGNIARSLSCCYISRKPRHRSDARSPRPERAFRPSVEEARIELGQFARSPWCYYVSRNPKLLSDARSSYPERSSRPSTEEARLNRRPPLAPPETLPLLRVACRNIPRERTLRLSKPSPSRLSASLPRTPSSVTTARSARKKRCQNRMDRLNRRI